ncbi:sensor histidine kinase [Haloplanus rubicundus]|uniref:histidine kinase n=1 Tax=Haloplanus rubicundus TaxID=1547898 RepID=A0A345EEB0_9EURY|nr:HAMP domain-containing sensor histidine kinase [Haloplanus rubicundus]AXG10532.1 sensor histidine kinase [Haloplanus rubicundus]
MTDAGSVAIPLDAFQDPVLAYAVEGRDARVMAANDAFERRFDARSSGTSVSTIFGRFPTIDTTADEEPLSHLVRDDRAGIYLDGYRDHGPYFVRVIPSDGTTGYLVFSDLAQCPNLGESPAIDQVSSVISHDLRNPLDVAKAHLQAARETGDAKHFDSVSNAHDRMERIIRDALTLTREDAVVDPSQQVSIETAATDAWQSVETDHATLDLPDSLPTTTADPDRIRRLFENLFRNSVEHSSTSSRADPGDSVEHGSTSPRSQTPEDSEGRSPSGSRPGADDSVEHGSTTNRRGSAGDSVEHGPEVGDTSARGDGTAPEGDVTITVGTLADGFYVADDGPGIPPEKRADVFEPGYSTQDGGTGLGLAIVERIVAAHDWELRLTAAELGGVRFEIQF